jgi:hypothetical protein
VTDRAGRGPDWPWQTWVFLVLAVGWAAVAVFSVHHRELTIGFAVVALALAALNVSRARGRNRE